MLHQVFIENASHHWGEQSYWVPKRHTTVARSGLDGKQCIPVFTTQSHFRTSGRLAKSVKLSIQMIPDLEVVLRRVTLAVPMNYASMIYWILLALASYSATINNPLRQVVRMGGLSDGSPILR